MTVHIVQANITDIAGFWFGDFAHTLAAGATGDAKTICLDCWINWLGFPDDEEDLNSRSELYENFAKVAHLISELRQDAITAYGVEKWSGRLPRVLVDNDISQSYWQTPPLFYRCDDCGKFLIPREIRNKAKDVVETFKESHKAMVAQMQKAEEKQHAA